MNVCAGGDVSKGYADFCVMDGIDGYEQLPKLREALQRELDLEEDSEKESLSE